MKNFLLATFMCFLAVSNAQEIKKEEEKSLDLSIGYGLYHQMPVNQGYVLGFSADYKINKAYKLSQLTQFGFMSEKITLGNTVNSANYVNQHISIMGTRNLFENRHFQLQAGAGLGYTNYHVVQVRTTDPGDGLMQGQSVTTQAVMQMSFPLMGEVNYLASKTVALGFKFGGYIPTHGGFINYKFIYPQVKFSL